MRSGPTSCSATAATAPSRRPRRFESVANLRDFAWADLDHDGDPDAAFLDDKGTLSVLDNERAGRVPARTAPRTGLGAEAARSRSPTSTATARWTSLLLGPDAIHRLSDRDEGALVGRWPRSSGGRRLRQGAAVASGSARPACFAADLDNNGGIDLVAVRGRRARDLARRTRGRLPPAGGRRPASGVRGRRRPERRRPARPGGALGRRAAAARPRTAARSRYHWQVIRPRAATAVGDQRINSFGIGGEVEVRTGLHVQKQAHHRPARPLRPRRRARGPTSCASSGRTARSSPSSTKGQRTRSSAEQRLKGSCPWLFAWNGPEMAFVTDLLWRSPLGPAHQRPGHRRRADDRGLGEGPRRPARAARRRSTTCASPPSCGRRTSSTSSRSWSSTTRRAPRCSSTSASPIAPAEAPASSATGPVHRCGRRATTGAATCRTWSQRARRPPPRLRGPRRLPGRHARPLRRDRARRRRRPRRGPLCLVAQGWVHPTDSSINVAIGAGGARANRGASSLEVADAAGRFREVRRGDLGFPAGKDKTVPRRPDRRLPRPGPPARCGSRTNLEIFWDRLGWAVGPAGPSPDPTSPRAGVGRPAVSWLLRDRRRADPGSPERPRYVLDGHGPRWRDLEGYYTRFGDVRELLAGVDDRYVIMNAGRRDASCGSRRRRPRRRAGVRDFVLIADGWEKDGDFNTTFSRTVLPLPTHARRALRRAAGRPRGRPGLPAAPARLRSNTTRGT